MLLSKLAEVPVQVLVRINELEEIERQFLDKVGKVLDLWVCILAELPEDADVDVVGTVAKSCIRKYGTNPIKERIQNQSHSLIGF